MPAKPAGNTTSKYRDYPEITLYGKPILEYGMAPEDYIDPGASCFDPSTLLAEQLQLSDSYTVDLRKAGTYKVNFTCTGSKGVKATPKTRIVIVDPKVSQTKKTSCHWCLCD